MASSSSFVPAVAFSAAHRQYYASLLEVHLEDLDAGEKAKFDECFTAGVDYLPAGRDELAGRAAKRGTAKSKKASKDRQSRFDVMYKRVAAAWSSPNGDIWLEAQRAAAEQAEAAAEAADGPSPFKRPRLDDPPEPAAPQSPGANDGVIGEAPDSSPLVQDSVWRAWRRRYPCGWPSDPPPSPASGMLYVRFIRARNDFMMQKYHRIMGRDGDEALLPRELRKWQSPEGRWHCPKCQCGRDTCPSWACWEEEMEIEETA